MKLSVSIVIPTFNEEKYLPNLLKSIQRQTIQPREIIVSDAFSEDKTRQIAKSFGCKVVDGGLPAKARNNGARAATQPILLFLDADVVLPPKFLEETVNEFTQRNLDIASCFIKPISTHKIDHIIHGVVNQYFNMTKSFNPHIPGFCIFVKKSIHQKIHGFDETIRLAEDHDYVNRAEKIGKFAYLQSYKIPVSIRRLSEEGRLTVALKYLAIELHLLFLGQIRRNIIHYKFGSHLR